VFSIDISSLGEKELQDFQSYYFVLTEPAATGTSVIMAIKPI
jgi:hypothetical protein